MIIKLLFLFFASTSFLKASEDLFSETKKTTTQQIPIKVPYSISQAIKSFWGKTNVFGLQEDIDQQTPAVRKKCCELIFEKVYQLSRQCQHTDASTLCLVVMNSQCALTEQPSAVNYLFTLSAYTENALSDLQNFVKVNKENIQRKEIWQYANIILGNLERLCEK